MIICSKTIASIHSRRYIITEVLQCAVKKKNTINNINKETVNNNKKLFFGPTE